ncbi:carbon starvation protein A [soil metagenome]
MPTLFVALGALVLYLVAYHTYGKWLARKIFRLDPAASVPSVALEDDADFVPTSRGIVFGHHFTSIAGTGPIVGPAIAVLWGWLPALLWVVFGSILIGAVHDFGALVISMRNRGQTVGDIAGRLLNPRVRVLFLCILFLSLTIVLAIFGLVIAAVFQQYPASIFPCLVQIPIAVAIGVWLHRKGVNLLVPSIVALGIMYLTVYLGDVGILGAFNLALSGWSRLTWVVVLLVYSYVASVLPVWSLLQPRDFINSLQLLTALGLIVIGLVVAAFVGGAPVVAGGTAPPLEIVAPAVEFSPAGAPLMIPFLFITIACGAISGFHCLVSSGTSSKQLKNEADAQFVGYGSMLTEGFLAVLVILACVAGIGLGIPEVVGGSPTGETLLGTAAWDARYSSWAASDGLASKVGSFVDGSANFIAALGLAPAFAVALMGVLVASFAATTLDTACRLQRYVIQELASTTRWLKPLENKHGATILAIAVAFALAALPATPGGILGTGGLILWPLFGATNQLLGGLAFLVISFWMWRRRIPVWFVVIPTVFMLILPAWVMVYQIFIKAVGSEQGWIAGGEYLLASIGIATLAMEIWMVAEALRAWPSAKGILEKELPPLPVRTT